MTKRKIYWLCQLLGWGIYGFIQVFLYTVAQGFDTNQALGVLYQVVYFIATTHFLRGLIIKREWLNLRLSYLIPRLLIATFLLSGLNYGYLLVIEFLTSTISRQDLMFLTVLINTLGYWVIYFIWAIFYFTFHYVERYNKSLKAETAAREVELKNLKEQLNPHFIFNALNSIRALVDENPRKSKESITQLSHILRNSLMSDRKKLIPFMDELKTVMDYLALESIRYEERLVTKFDIDRNSGKFMIPPLMLQTLVENGIKHGISNLKEGGEIKISTTVKRKQLHLQIRNTGQLSKEMHAHKGFGLANTRKRLELIFGSTAKFEIKNEDKNTVLTSITLPTIERSMLEID
ncbi:MULTISPECIES: histidine kinase [unclassified Ekhidna]|jgi:two-component system LytT family sensor kinase|uniref:sensor histidine kinase n=1 Tax=unclassified Ekhidna TaxID=2632188 RepID=UPI0032DF1F6D